MIDGLLFVGEDYLICREVVVLFESKCIEFYWICICIYDVNGVMLKVEMLLNYVILKYFYVDYEVEVAFC